MVDAFTGFEMTQVTLVSLARNFGWGVENESAVHAVEDALRSQGSVGFCSEFGEREDLLWGATGRVEILEDSQQLRNRSFDAAMIVTHRLVEEQIRDIPYPVAVIRPKNLAVGLINAEPVGGEELQRRVRDGIRSFGLAWGSVAKLATANSDPGRDAVEALTEEFKLRYETFSEDRLNEVTEPGGSSGRANPQWAESAAILASGSPGSSRNLMGLDSLEGPTRLAVALITRRLE